jgi:isochorismate synthase
LDDRSLPIDESEGYKVAFRSFKYQLDREHYQKLVLSFSQLKEWDGSGKEDELFVRAMDRFPTSMVYLVYTRKGGRWFGCTPELLLEGYGMKWHTMALAGTRTWEHGNWNEKNSHEQRMVSDYIEGQLQSLGARITRHGPYTSKAGHLFHLRTDYTFHLPKPTSPLKILNLLHPTPALCGLPKMEAWNFIRLFERNKRMYYGGYLGPLNLRAETNIFVNIRCAQMRPGGKALFFAGGGLTRNSIFSEEKEEIKRKMETLLAALS